MESFIQRLVKLGPSALSAMGIVREAVRATANVRNPIERRQKVEHMVRCLAAGADGVNGTEDDLLSREAVEQLVKLLHMGIIGDIADELMKALATIPPLRLPSCFQC